MVIRVKFQSLLHFIPVLIVVIIAHLDVLEYGDGVVGEGGQREVLREQVRGHTELVETHQTGTQRWRNLAGDAALVQTDDALVLLAGTHEDNLRGTYAATCQILTFYLDLVRRNQGHTAP